jgi:hypothetical protein
VRGSGSKILLLKFALAVIRSRCPAGEDPGSIAIMLVNKKLGGIETRNRFNKKSIPA